MIICPRPMCPMYVCSWPMRPLLCASLRRCVHIHTKPEAGQAWSGTFRDVWSPRGQKIQGTHCPSTNVWGYIGGGHIVMTSFLYMRAAEVQNELYRPEFYCICIGFASILVDSFSFSVRNFFPHNNFPTFVPPPPPPVPPPSPFPPSASRWRGNKENLGLC